MVRCAGLATVTFGGAGAACCRGLSPQPLRTDARATRSTAAKPPRGMSRGKIRADAVMGLMGKVMQEADNICAGPYLRSGIARLCTAAQLFPGGGRLPISVVEPHVHQETISLLRARRQVDP